MDQEPALGAAAAALDTPLDQQTPKAEKALTLVNFQTPDQRLIDQIAVPQDTNEEAAVAAQIFRLDQQVDYLRRGQVIKTTSQSRYGVSSLYPEEADPTAVLKLVRGYWAIETKPHDRRDHTQREDHCQVRQSTAARNLSLMRSLAIFLFERQRHRRHGRRSLPDWQKTNHRQPNPLITLGNATSG